MGMRVGNSMDWRTDKTHTQPSETLKISWGNPENYEVTQKIGRGKYSEVFRGRNVLNGEGVVIKVLKPVKGKKIKREIQILQNVYGGVNVIKLLDVVRDPSTGTPALVFESINNTSFKVLYPLLTDEDVRHYLFQLLKATEFAHSQGIMHRDIKPQNIMIDHSQRRLWLIDWGLAELYLPGFCYNVRVASRFFKGPELLVNLQDYDYSLDLWSIGCVMAGMIFQREPFFRGTDNQDQLVKIAKVLGTDELYAYLAKYGLTLDEYYDDRLPPCPRRPWVKFVNKDNTRFYSTEAIDLLHSMLQYDHMVRPTAAEAMAHPFFDPIREPMDPAGASELVARESDPALFSLVDEAGSSSKGGDETPGVGESSSEASSSSS